MKEFLQKTQKIKATCIVRNNGRILLLRSDQVVNREHRPLEGYFGIPCFTVSFGDDPKTTLQKAFYDYFNQSVDDFSVLDVRHYMSDDNTTQIFEIVYSTKNVAEIQVDSRYGKCLFVHQDELDVYMFPTERERLEKYL